MNQFEAVAAAIEKDHPGWQAWYVPRAIGKPAVTWHARRWGTDPARCRTSRAGVNLADAIERAEKEAD